MHFLVLGATGSSGLVFVEEALQAGHAVTIYARNPSKLPPDVKHNNHAHIVVGEFTDMTAMRRALSKGAEILVSFAGPAVPNRGMAITEFYQRLFPVLPTESSVTRCFILSTASYKAEGDQWSLKWWLGTFAIWLIAGTAWSEVNGMSRATVSLLTGRVAWTLFRVPRLTNNKPQTVQAGMVGSGRDGLFLSRASIPGWILREVEECKWIDQAPAVSNPGCI